MLDKFFIFVLSLTLSTSLFSQEQKEIDSLKNCLSKKLHDTTKLNVLLKLANYYRFTEPVKGKKYSLLSITSAKDNKRQKSLGEAYHYLASSYFQIGNYDSSEIVNQQALLVRLKINDEKGLAATYTNLGQITGDKGNSELAFSYLYKAEKIYEKLKMDKNLAIVYNSIGNLYYSQKLYELAYKYMQKSLSIRIKIGDNFGSISPLNNLGHITYFLFGADSAKLYYEAAVNTALGIGDTYTQIQSLNNLGAFYMDVKEYDKALMTIQKAIRIGEGTEYEVILSNSYMNYAKLLMSVKKDGKQALFYALKAEKLIHKENLPEQIYQAKSTIASIYSDLGNYPLAYSNMYDAYLMKDTFIRQSVQQQMSDLESKYQNEKKQLEIKNLKQQEMLSQVEITAKTSEVNRKNLQLTMVVIFSLFLLVMGYFVWKAYKQKKKDNVFIQMQKDLVEEKNKEILDSITYAKRLQDAILPPQNFVNQFIKQNFILYQPKDIVAGDFYWMEVVSRETGELGQENSQLLTPNSRLLLIAAADCTGHGVPGAMVSVVCSNALNRAVKEFGIIDPGKILDKATELVIETFVHKDSFGEKSENEVKDGMDISLISLKSKVQSSKLEKSDVVELKWAGANNPLWIIKQNELIEIKANKQAIGKNEKLKDFTTHTIELCTNDVIYLFTDGYADQFGGDKGKKFKYKKLQELLLANVDKPMLEQKEILNISFNTWKGNLEQVDDVCIIGVRI